MTATTVVYHGVPAEVAHVGVIRWRIGTAGVALPLSIQRNDGTLAITFDAVSGEVFVQLRRADGSYLADGPFVPRDETAERRVDGVWRRTVQGHIGAAGSPGGLDWLGESAGSGSPWPACSASVAEWECIGVPLDEAGVVFGRTGDRLLSAIVHGASTPVLRSSAWGRLVVVSDRGGGTLPRLRVQAAHPVSSASRRAGVRLETAAIADVQVAAISPSAVWISGDSSPPSAWIEVRSARSGPQYLPLADVIDGPPQLPVPVMLDDMRAVDASVVTARSEHGAAALVTTFRLIDGAAKANAGGSPPRRVLVSEALAGADGEVRIEGLGDAAYEIVAWHPQFGRASLLLPAGADRVTIRLQSPGIARGRVLAGGKPVAGADVISVPDPAAFAAAEDPLDVKGGDARTGADGRFWLTVAPGGGGELRVGGGAYPVRRIPLPRAPLPLVDLGDIELGRPIPLSVRLDQDPGCDLRAAGPIGRSGLQIVTGTRRAPGVFAFVLPEEGSWELSLMCGRQERDVAPSRVSVSAPPTAAAAPQEVRVMVK